MPARTQVMAEAVLSSKEGVSLSMLYMSMSELEDYARVYGVSMMSVVTLANLMC
jgi:hypothetical protein